MSIQKYHRKKLMSVLKDGLIFVASSEISLRNSDVDYLFRQDSNFLYLTGITHPGHALALDPKDGKSHLFIPDVSAHHQIWIGHQMTVKEAKKVFAMDYVHYFKDFNTVMGKLTRKYKKTYALPNALSVLGKYKIKIRTHKDSASLRIALGELRVRKSPEEVELMRLANQISHRGHIAAMKTVRPDMHEYQVQAVMECEFLNGGATHNAYPSIVASGRNAAVLHYHENTARCADGDLLLIDAGCEVQGYASDVTRAFPVNGRFTDKQKEIYQVVLKAQNECIRMIRPDVSVLDLHKHACHSMTRGLMDLGIFYQGDVETLVAQDTHAVFFPHGIGHLIGLDVHDVGAIDPKAKPIKNKPKHLRASRKLEPGFAVTVEPGIYFIDAHFDSKATRKKTAKYINWNKADEYRNVGGIRIEDDVLVTKNGFENLTTVPKEVREIEEIMNS